MSQLGDSRVRLVGNVHKQTRIVFKKFGAAALFEAVFNNSAQAELQKLIYASGTV